MTHGLSVSPTPLGQPPKRRWWPVPVAAAAGLLLGLSTGSEPLGVAVLFGVIAAIVMGSNASTAVRRSASQNIWEFLGEVHEDGVIDAATYGRLVDALRVRGHQVPSDTAGVSRGADASAESIEVEAAPPVGPVASAAAPGPVTVPVEAPVRSRRRRPLSKVRMSAGSVPGLAPLRRFGSSLASDFAVQGLGSLGVLLVFTGTLGFVLFAFSEVGAGFRPAAELLVPLVLAGLAWFLYRREARFVAAAMEFLAGAVIPVMAFAAFVDGAPAPPDLGGTALVIVLAGTSLVLAVAYATVVRRRPNSPLRFLVAPLGWVTFGVLGLAFHAGASAAQMALVTVAVAATAWLVRIVRPSPLAMATRTVTAPGLAIAYALTLVFALAEDWALLPVLIAGAAVIGGVEAMRLPSPAPWLVQGAVVATSAAIGLAAWPAGWVGFAAVVACLALTERWATDPAARPAVAVMLTGAVAATLAAATDAVSLAAAATALSLWAHVRRTRPLTAASALPTVIVAAVAPLAAVAGLAGVVGAGPALLTAAMVVAVGSLAARRWLAGDGFYALWLPAAAVLVAAFGALAGLLNTSYAATASAAIALSVVPIAVSWFPVGWRIWLIAVFLGVAAAMGANAAGIGTQPQLVLLAATGLALVAVGARSRGRGSGHLALVGHAATAIALAISGDQQIAAGAISARALILVMLTAWAAGWLIEVVLDRTAPLPRLFRTHQRAVVAIADALFLLSVPVIALLAIDIALPTSPAMSGIAALTPLGVLYVVAGRVVRSRHSLQASLLGGGVAMAVAAALLAGTLDVFVPADRMAMVGSLSGIVAAVSLVPASLRTSWMEWIGWAATAPLTFVLATAAGLESGAQHWAWFAWGAVAAAGALFVDDLRNGRRPAGSAIRERWLVPPLALGVPVAVLGLAPATVVPFPELYVPAAAAATLALVLAVQLRLGAISIVTWIGGVVAYASLLEASGWDLVTDPWPLVVPAIAAAGVGLLVTGMGSPARRWDLPAFAAAVATGSSAVALGLSAGATASTWLPIGAACLVIAVLRRIPAVAVVGALLILGAAFLASAAWFAVALAVTSLATGVGATMGPPQAQQPLQWTSASSGGGAWLYALAAVDASLETAATLTLSATAVIAIVTAALAIRSGDAVWAATRPGPWAAMAGFGLVVALVFAGFSGSSVLFWLAAGVLAVWSASAASVAEALDIEPLRGGAVGLGIGAVGATGFALELSRFGWMVLTISGAMALTVLALALWHRDPSERWVRHLAAAVVGVDLAAVAIASQPASSRSALAVVMLGGAAQTLAAGVVTDQVRLLKATPPLMFTAWVLSLSESLAGEVQWVTTPAALAVLAVVEIARWDRRRNERTPVATEELRLAELAALALLVGPALFQTVFVAVPYGLLAVVQGIAVALWGAATKVRRRVYAGGAAAVLGALLMLAVPLAALVPQIRGVALWVALGTIGAILLAVAATIEQTRRKLADVRASWGDATAEWE